MADINDDKLPVAVILTAIPLEFQSICQHLVDIEEAEHHKGNIYKVGVFKGERNNFTVGVAEVGAGNDFSDVRIRDFGNNSPDSRTFGYSFSSLNQVIYKFRCTLGTVLRNEIFDVS